MSKNVSNTCGSNWNDTAAQAHSITLKNVERGKYFRIVATVEADGQDVSDLLIQEGLAVPYEGGTKGKNWCA